MSIPLWPQCIHLLMLLPAGKRAVFQSSNHLKLVSWTWRWVHCTQLASTVTRSKSYGAPLGCGGPRGSHHGCAADKSAATMLSCQYGPKSLRDVSSTLLSLCPEDLKPFWRQKGVQPGTSQVYQIKWTVSVYWRQVEVGLAHQHQHLFFLQWRAKVKGEVIVLFDCWNQG